MASKPRVKRQQFTIKTVGKPSDRVDLVFKGLSRLQADTLAHWYEGQGEQQQYVWFADRGVRAPLVDVHEPECIEHKARSIIVKTRTPL